MEFNLNDAIQLLSNTPSVLASHLNNVPNEWLKANEGPDTWSPYDIVGHLIYGEKTDWIVRTQLILSTSTSKTFEPFDRFAQFNEKQDKPISALISEFKTLREDNLNTLKTFNLNNKHLNLLGTHPELGEVSLKQLLAAWVVHDLSHISQISRVMAKQYDVSVGPWKSYLGILNR